MPKSKGHAASLKEYHAKRRFDLTPEPKGNLATDTKRSKKKKEPIFVVQKHLASHLHYDFRLEHKGTLLSWAVPKGPSLNPKDKRLAMRVEDHPLDYADFEGVIPEGYGAGVVMVWDKGTWTPLNGNVDEALKKGELKFELHGVKLKGSWVLVRTRDERTWLLIKHKDEWAGDVDVIELAPLSVKSFSDFPDILAQEKPDIWESHLPAKGGAAGKMLQDIIAKAAKIKAARPAGKAKNKSRTRKRAAARHA